MTAIQYVAWFVFMAVAVMTILVLWVLGGAGLLRRPRKHRDAEASGIDWVERATPRRSNPAPDARPADRGRTLDPGSDHDYPQHGQVA